MGLNNPGGTKGAVKPVSCAITNGGFETGDLTGWSTYCQDYTCVQSVKSGGAFKGTYYGYLYGHRHLLNPAWGGVSSV